MFTPILLASTAVSSTNAFTPDAFLPNSLNCPTSVPASSADIAVPCAIKLTASNDFVDNRTDVPTSALYACCAFVRLSILKPSLAAYCEASTRLSLYWSDKVLDNPRFNAELLIEASTVLKKVKADFKPDKRDLFMLSEITFLL